MVDVYEVLVRHDGDGLLMGSLFVGLLRALVRDHQFVSVLDHVQFFVSDAGAETWFIFLELHGEFHLYGV